MKPRSSRPRQGDIARAAGVSPATVSRAFANPAIVRPEKLRAVRDAALRLGYRAPALPALPDMQATKTIGVIVPTLDNAIFSRALQAMQSSLAASGHQMLVASSDYSPQVESEEIAALIARGVDGLVLVGAQRGEDVYGLLADADLPVVLTWCGHPDFDAVTVDNREAGRLAARHLLELGHRRVGVICGARRYNDRQRLRVEGAREALRAEGLDLPDWAISEQAFTLAGGRIGCSEMLGLSERPTALVCCIDLLAVGALVEAQSRVMAVPEHLSIIGIDNLEMAAHLSPPLTTVHIPTEEIGARAAELVLRPERRGRTPRHVQLGISLVGRKTTGRPAG